MTLRIFIVDQGRLAAEGVAALLRFMGHEVRAVSCGATVLEEALAFRPDVAFIDWTVADAVQVCQGLALSGTRMIAVGTEADARRLPVAPEAHLAAFLALPCDRSKLSHVMATAEEDVFAYRDEAKSGGRRLEIGFELGRRRWAYLAERTVFRLLGGVRDGQDLFGNRAAELYLRLDEDPLHRTFLACRCRLIHTGHGIVDLIERHRYFVESVTESPDQILVVARSLGLYD